MRNPFDDPQNASEARTSATDDVATELELAQERAEQDGLDPSERAILERIDSFIQARRPQPDVEAALAVHRARRELVGISEAPRGHVGVPARSYGQRWVAVAAAVIGIVIAGWQVSPRALRIDRASLSTSQTFVTRPGQSMKVRLADGSLVTIAPETKVQYTARPNGERHVALDGEALFTVVHNEGGPFVVQAGDAMVRVLGTTFSVRRFEADTVTQVVVAQGKVAVNTQVLSSGEIAWAGAHGATRVERGANISAALGWTTGSLVFRRSPLKDVIPELERWYGVNVVVQDARTLEMPVTAEFLLDAPNEMVEILTSLLNVRVVRSGTTMVIGERTPQ
jgi:transmembrane sensor